MTDNGTADAGAPGKKGKPTPKRKEREAAHKRPLVMDMKTDAKARRERAKAQREKEYAAMRTGNERDLPVNHQGPARRFARDFIDSRLTIGEFMLPVSMLAFLVLWFGGAFEALVNIIALVFMVTLVGLFIESIVLLRKMKRLAVEKFGAKNVPSGYVFYGLTRLLQFRRLRMPRARVKIGERPDAK